MKQSTEQRTWDQLRVSLLREYLRSYLSEVAESDLELAAVTDETVERLVPSLGGQAVSASDTSATLLRELANLVERTSQLSGKFTFSLSELEMIRAQVIAEAQGQGIPERAAKQLLDSARPVHVERESEEGFHGLALRIARLEGVNAEVSRLFEAAKLALQRDVIGLLSAIILILIIEIFLHSATYRFVCLWARPQKAP